jgi:hypothetical protein
VSDQQPPQQPPTWGAPGSTGNDPVVAPTGVTSPPVAPPTTSIASYGAATGESMGSYIPAPPAPKRRRALVAGAVAGALALGAGGLAVAARSGSDGAASPQAAVQKLLSSAEQSDLVGVMDALVPGERELMRQPMLDTIAELKRLEILDKKANPTKVDALVMTFDGEAFNELAINDRITTVEMTAGTMTVKGDGSKIPFGKLVQDLADPDSLPKPEEATSDTTDMEGVKITTVKVDGSWHVSVLYSVAESARNSGDNPAPSDASKIATTGSDSPEAAVKDMVDAIADLNLRRVIELLPPDEYAVLKDYGYLFVPQAEEAVAQLPADFDVTVELPVRIAGSGDRRSAIPTSFKISGTADGNSASAEYDPATKCIKVTVDGETNEVCTDDAQQAAEDSGAMTDEMKQFTDDMNNMFDRTKLADVGFTVRNVGGKWFVTPLGTMTDAMVAVMKSIKAPELRSLLTRIKEEGAENFIGGLFGLGGDVFGGTPFGDIGDFNGIDGFTTDEEFNIDPNDDGTYVEPDFPSDTFPDGTLPEFPEDTGPPATDPMSLCFDEAGKSENYSETYDACIAAAVERGELPKSALPLAAQFPECAEVLNVDLYEQGLTVVDIKAKLAAQLACLQPHIDSGEIESYQLDPLMLKPECLDIANVYDFSVDSELLDKAYECLYE